MILSPNKEPTSQDISEIQISNNNSPNESIKSFKEFRTIKLLRNRDANELPEEILFNDDTYNQLTFNESAITNSTVSLPDISRADGELRKSQNRKSYNNSFKRTSANSDLYSIFNGKNRLSIAIFSDLDCVSIKDDETVIDLDTQEEVSEEDFLEDAEGICDEEITQMFKPLRRYNSYESILSQKQVLDVEPEKLTFNDKSKQLDSLYLGSFTKQEEKFKRSYNYLRNGQLSYLTSQPMIALNDRKAVTTTTNKVMDSNVLISPFMLPLRSSTKKKHVDFKTSESLREHLNAIRDLSKTSHVNSTTTALVNITTTKVDETTIDFETKTIKRKSSIMWDLPKRNTSAINFSNSSSINKNPFLNTIPQRQPSLKIKRKGEAVVDNGTEVYSSNIQVDLLQDALSEI
ncbi:hypothetical protein QEN19_003000 [Hanseniaspora menglaensis]